MKRLSCLFTFCFLFFTSLVCYGADTIDFTQPKRITRNVYSFTISIVGGTSGALTEKDTPFDIDGYVFLAIINPGATAPTDDYSLLLTDSNDVKIFGTALDDLDTATSEQAVPLLDGTDYGPRFVAGVISVDTGSDQTTTGAIIVVTIYFYR